MRKLLLLVLIVFSLGGCVAPTTLPPYVVMLTSPWPVANSRCTGVMIDDRHVLTASHCTGLTRIVTQSGQQAGVYSIMENKDTDVAVLETTKEIFVAKYAEFSTVNPRHAAVVWGNCPYYFPNTYRVVVYGGFYRFNLVETEDGIVFRDYDRWVTTAFFGDDTKICGGDSGGVVVQSGKVVGLISAVKSDIGFYPLGSVVMTVSSQDIADSLK